MSERAFGIRHRVDGTWWIAGGSPQSWEGWSVDAMKARRFICKQDALDTAYVECMADPSDFSAEALPIHVPDPVLA